MTLQWLALVLFFALCEAIVAHYAIEPLVVWP